MSRRLRSVNADGVQRELTKQEMDFDAFCGKFVEPMQLIEGAIDDDMSTRDAPLHAGQRMSAVASDASEAIRAAACEIRRDTELAAALEEQVNCPNARSSSASSGAATFARRPLVSWWPTSCPQ